MQGVQRLNEVYLAWRAKRGLGELGSKTREGVLEALVTLRDYGFSIRLDIIPSIVLYASSLSCISQ